MEEGMILEVFRMVEWIKDLPNTSRLDKLELLRKLLFPSKLLLLIGGARNEL